MVGVAFFVHTYVALTRKKKNLLIVLLDFFSFYSLELCEEAQYQSVGRKEGRKEGFNSKESS